MFSGNCSALAVALCLRVNWEVVLEHFSGGVWWGILVGDFSGWFLVRDFGGRLWWESLEEDFLKRIFCGGFWGGVWWRIFGGAFW